VKRCDPMVTALVITWVLVVLAGIGGVVWIAQREQARTAACAAQGWERADTRGGLCVDDDGVVRAP